MSLNVELDPVDRERLEAIAKQEGRRPEELAPEVFRQGLIAREARLPLTDVEAEGEHQLDALEELMREADKLPRAPQNDRLSGSFDHDEILYGKGSM